MKNILLYLLLLLYLNLILCDKDHIIIFLDGRSDHMQHITSTYNSFILALDNIENKENIEYIIYNITSNDECVNKINNLSSLNVILTISLLNFSCLKELYHKIIEINSLLIYPDSYTFSECIRNSFFGGLFVHEMSCCIFYYLYSFFESSW